MAEIDGPYIVWENYGVEGWRPKSYSNLADALCSPRYCSEWEITKKLKLEMAEDGKVSIGP